MNQHLDGVNDMFPTISAIRSVRRRPTQFVAQPYQSGQLELASAVMVSGVLA